MVCYYLFFLQVIKNTPEIEEDVDNGGGPVVSNPVLMGIEVKSADVLEVTMTKTCLQVLNNLGKVRC